jgi:hypothetical protein
MSLVLLGHKGKAGAPLRDSIKAQDCPVAADFIWIAKCQYLGLVGQRCINRLKRDRGSN